MEQVATVNKVEISEGIFLEFTLSYFIPLVGKNIASEFDTHTQKKYFYCVTLILLSQCAHVYENTFFTLILVLLINVILTS